MEGACGSALMSRLCSRALGADLLKLTREDVIQICGPADGIRLFNALKGRWVHSPGNCFASVTVVDLLFHSDGSSQGRSSQADHLRLPGVSADPRAAGETRKRRCCHQHLLWLVAHRQYTFDWATCTDLYLKQSEHNVICAANHTYTTVL